MAVFIDGNDDMKEDDQPLARPEVTDACGPPSDPGAADRQGSRLTTGLVIMTLAVVIAYLVNQMLPHVNLATERWEPVYLFPSLYPVGTDFRSGLYYPAKVLLEGKSLYVFYSSVYPPFGMVAGVPSQILGVDMADLAQAVVLWLLNLITLWLALQIIRAIVEPQTPDRTDWLADAPTIAVFLAMAFMTLGSCGFQFSVERGNFGIYTVLPALLGLWLLLARPKSLWLQVLCFSIAAH